MYASMYICIFTYIHICIEMYAHRCVSIYPHVHMPAYVHARACCLSGPKIGVCTLLQVLELPTSCPNAWSPALVAIPQEYKQTEGNKGLGLGFCSVRNEAYEAPTFSRLRCDVGLWSTEAFQSLGLPIATGHSNEEDGLDDERAREWFLDKTGVHGLEFPTNDFILESQPAEKHQFMMYIARVAGNCLLELPSWVLRWRPLKSYHVLSPVIGFTVIWVARVDGEGWSMAVPYSMHWAEQDW